MSVFSVPRIIAGVVAVAFASWLIWAVNDRNKLSGSVDLTKLPAGMAELNLGRNQFSGRVDLSKLPAGMTKLNLSGNHKVEIDKSMPVKLPKGCDYKGPAF